MIVRHIYLGPRQERSWCNLYVGFHNPKPGIIESDYKELRDRDLGANICRNCRRIFDAAEKRAAA